MFTGLTETLGVIRSRNLSGGAGKLCIESGEEFSRLEIGESISVNGCCLTLEKHEASRLTFHVLAETLSKTNLGGLPIGSRVNLERAMMPSGRFGGHIVSGHIDGVCRILSLGRAGDDIVLEAEIPEGFGCYFVLKGSVALDGVSLTLASVSAVSFSVHLIPLTWSRTSFSMRKTGDMLNFETDIIGKYVHRHLESMLSGSGKAVTLETLFEAGF